MFTATGEPASGHLDDGLHDGALSRDGFGVGLVVALGFDQVYQLVGQVDVGVFQRVGLDGTQRTNLRCIVAGLARSEGFLPGRAAHWLQTLLVGEAGQGYLANRTALVVAEVSKHHAGAVDGQVVDLTGRIAVLCWRIT